MIGLRIGTGFCEHGNEHFFFIKRGELVIQVCAYCVVGGVHYVMWDRHHLCPSSALQYRKKGIADACWCCREILQGVGSCLGCEVSGRRFCHILKHSA